ncbi:MAG: hypothetical protein AAGJ83_13025 [Planctomycetota bacterium]
MLRSVFVTAVIAIAVTHAPSAKAAPIDWIPVAGTWQLPINAQALTFQFFLPTGDVGGNSAGTILINGHPGRYVFARSSAAGGVIHIQMRQPHSIRFKAVVKQQGNRMLFQADSNVHRFNMVAPATMVPPSMDQWAQGHPQSLLNGSPQSGPMFIHRTKGGPPLSPEAQVLQSIFREIDLLTKK